MSRRRFFQCLAVAVLTACILGRPAVLTAQSGNVVPGSFVCLVDGSEDPFVIGQRAVEATGGTLGFVYTHALKGFSIGVPPGIVMANLRAQHGVTHVEPDLILHTCGTIPTGVDRIDAEGVAISCGAAGIAIIDTGIDVDHPDLNVQTEGVHCYLGGTGPLWRRSVYTDTDFDDDSGHGTHCAGIAAANGGIVGVAPGARLYAVKVLDSNGSGYMSAIAAGIDWVADHATGLDIRVANMSLGGQGASEALYVAMRDCGVTFTVAAGNDGRDIYGPDGVYGGGDDFIPAAYGGVLSNVLTISAMVDTDGKPGGSGPATSAGPDDSFASFSNYSDADVIDYILPGVMIESTYIGGGTATMSGTSMAAPHMAGLLAIALAGGSYTSRAQSDSTYGLKYLYPNSYGDPDNNPEPLGYSIYPGGGGGDAAPSVTISTPTDGASFASGTQIGFEGTATDAENGDLTSSLGWTSSINEQIGTGGSFLAFLSDGTHTITASVTDSGGHTASDTITITVGSTAPPEPTEMYVWDLEEGNSFQVNRNKWRAAVNVWVGTTDGAVSGATVYGTFTPGGSFSGVTDTEGLCTLTSGNISIKDGTTFFTVDSVTKEGYTYAPEKNLVDTEIALTRP